MKKWEENIRKVVPYVAGEQPEGKDIIKLNTNENPFPHCGVEILKDKPLVLSRGDTTIRKLENQCFEKVGFKPKVVSSLNSHMGAIIMAKTGDI